MTARQRFTAMFVATVGCFVIAFAAIVAHVSFGQAWALPLFVLAILSGFGAQIWFVVGLMQSPAIEKGA
jgi:hypothetical protein